MTDTRVAEIAAKLSGPQRAIVLALCGNAWQGKDPTPGIVIAQGLGLMRVEQLGRKFKAYPTELGQSVRAFLAEGT